MPCWLPPGQFLVVVGGGKNTITGKLASWNNEYLARAVAITMVVRRKKLRPHTRKERIFKDATNPQHLGQQKLTLSLFEEVVDDEDVGLLVDKLQPGVVWRGSSRSGEWFNTSDNVQGIVHPAPVGDVQHT